MDETLPHLLSCASPGSSQHQTTALSELQKDLKALNTPQEVVDAIAHGMIVWTNPQQGEQVQVHALTAGSLRGPDVLLMTAFSEQFHSIGWFQLLME
jgi:hypothetical protein